jgi:methylated-DNA-[protein]-cysteine S-methyltransferase
MTAAFALFSTAFGDCGIAWTPAAVTATRLPERDGASMRAWFTRRGMAEAAPDGPAVAAIAGIRALLATGREDLQHLPCDYGTTDPLMCAIYELTRRIAPGDVSTYGEVAAAAGDRALARLVGQAMAKNPLPVIVPCHRVLGSGGAMTGFSAEGGVDLKRRLLALEGAPEAGFAF